jgi:carbonic anhydrase
VVPELIFDTGLGEIFTVRVAGNVANTSSIASIEYAVAQLGSKVIVVMGHESCGAVAAAIAGGDNGPNLNHLLAHITPVVESQADKDMATIIKKNATLAAEKLVSDSEILAQAVRNEQIKILVAYYHLTSGKVDFF